MALLGLDLSERREEHGLSTLTVAGRLFGAFQQLGKR
jgi:hypothetical protein